MLILKLDLFFKIGTSNILSKIILMVKNIKFQKNKNYSFDFS